MQDIVLVYSDVHFRRNGSFPPYNQLGECGFTKETENIINGCRFVANKIVELKPKLVVNAGDTFHNQEFVSTSALHGAAEGFSFLNSACNEVGCKHLVIPGNHEIAYEGNGSLITSVQVLRGFVDNIFCSKIVYDLDGFKIGFLPYNSSSEMAYMDLVELQEQCDLLITHLDFAGCKYESGMKSESKISSQLAKPCISGHVHVPQAIGSIVYVGSLIQHKFFTYSLNNVGGVLTYDLNNGSISRFPNNFSKHYVKLDLELCSDFRTKLPPELCLLQVYSKKDREDVESLLEGYEYFYLKKMKGDRGWSNGDKGGVINTDIEDPKTLLRDYIKNDNPDALETFDKKMKV